MQSLKPGWKMVKFGDVVANANLVEKNPEENGITRIVGLEHIDPENLHIHRWNNISEGTSFTRKFVPGQTLFGKRRAYQRKVAYAEFTGICSGDILTFEPKDRNILLPELLPFICQSDAFFSHALDTSAGSLSPRTSWTALKNFSFPLPPLEEQKRLAELLWAADEAVNKFYSCKEQLSKFITIYIENIKNKFPNTPWEIKKLGDIAKVERGKFSHRPRNLPQFYGGPYPFAQTGDIRKSNGEITKFEYTLTDEGVKYSKSFPAGTILITIAAVIGATAITTRETWATDSVVGIIPQENVDTYFLEYILRTKRNYLENIAATQTAQKNINLQILRPLEIILPPIEIQRIIVQEIGSFKNKLLDFDSHILRYQKLINSLSNSFEKEYV